MKTQRQVTSFRPADIRLCPISDMYIHNSMYRISVSNGAGRLHLARERQQSVGYSEFIPLQLRIWAGSCRVILVQRSLKARTDRIRPRPHERNNELALLCDCSMRWGLGLGIVNGRENRQADDRRSRNVCGQHLRGAIKIKYHSTVAANETRLEADRFYRAAQSGSSTPRRLAK